LDFLPYCAIFLGFLALLRYFSWISCPIALFFLDAGLRLFPFLLVRPPGLALFFTIFSLNGLAHFFILRPENHRFFEKNPGKTREKPGKIFGNFFARQAGFFCLAGLDRSKPVLTGLDRPKPV